MALSSCTYLASGAAQTKGNFFKEEASACKDIFEDEGEFLELKKQSPFMSSAADLAEPVIGVQYRAKYNIGTELAPDYRIAVRFIAAIKSLDVNATWTRSVYEPDGDIYGTEAPIATTKAYTSLNSNNEPITPEEFAGSGYQYFVAYSLYDIPFSEKDEYFISAYVTLSDTESSLPSVSSLRMAARIGGDVTVKFPKDTTGYFLAGTIGGSANQIVAQEGTTPEGNLARFESALEENDSFFVCNNDTANSKFKVYDSSCLAYANNPFLRDDGSSAKKIKVFADHNYAFNFSNSYQLSDLYAGYEISYTNNSEGSVSAPLIYAGVDGSSKHQYYAGIAPKTGSTLSFTLDGAPIAPTKEGDANISDGLVVTYGADDIGVYLKEQGASDYSLWVGYPALSFKLYLNDVEQTAVSDVPAGWTDKAVFEAQIDSGVSVKVKWGYTLISASSNTPADSYYRIYLHADNTVTFDNIACNYRLVGTIYGEDKWGSDDYKFVRNATADEEYKLWEPVTLKNGDELKVKSTTGDWYPSVGSNYTVSNEGEEDYQVYFRPGKKYDSGWHYDYFYVAQVVNP